MGLQTNDDVTPEEVHQTILEMREEGYKDQDITVPALRKRMGAKRGVSLRGAQATVAKYRDDFFLKEARDRLARVPSAVAAQMQDRLVAWAKASSHQVGADIEAGCEPVLADLASRQKMLQVREADIERRLVANEPVAAKPTEKVLSIDPAAVTQFVDRLLEILDARKIQLTPARAEAADVALDDVQDQIKSIVHSAVFQAVTATLLDIRTPR